MPASLGSTSLWLMVRGLHTEITLESNLCTCKPIKACTIAVFPAGLSSQLMLLLFVWKGLPGWWEVPVDQGEAAENEEYSSPPQDLLALSV